MLKKTEENNKKNASYCLKSNFFSDDYNIDVSRVFPMIVLATMSSGKSTLINAMLDCEILPSKNEACTAKIYSILDDDNRTSPMLYIKDNNNNVTIYKDNIKEKLKEANDSNDVSEIFISGQVKHILNTDRSLLIIDTPGPNNSGDVSHERITMNALNKINGGILAYMINATQIGIKDDKAFVENVLIYAKKHPRLKTVFIINKIDELDPESEPIDEYVNKVRDYLLNCGAEAPEIIPISALGANLFRKVIAGESLSRFQIKKFNALYEKFHSEDFDMRSFALTDELKNQNDIVIVDGLEYKVSDILSAIDNTGVPYFEHYIQQAQIISSRSENKSTNNIIKIETGKQKIKASSSENKVKNSLFTINLFSDNNSGQSTLINALLHKDLLLYSSEACTSTLTRICNNNDNRLKVTCVDQSNREIISMDLVNSDMLAEYENDNTIKYINIVGNFPALHNDKADICFIDTPSLHIEKCDYVVERYSFLKPDSNSIVIYVLDPYYSYCENRFLEVIAYEMKRLGSKANDKFIFVLNKCDEINQKPDYYVKNTIKLLASYGISNPIIIPTSAKMAMLINKREAKEELTRNEIMFLNQEVEFMENKFLHLENYATLPYEIIYNTKNKFDEKAMDKTLLHTGIPVLEDIIWLYIDTLKANGQS